MIVRQGWTQASGIKIVTKCFKWDSYVVGFTGSVRSFDTLNSIDNDQNIALDKGTYSPRRVPVA